MKLSVRIADPAGNITAFVLSRVAPENCAAVASRLLVSGEFHTEQVAFRTEPRMGADGRIQMMGGEFCGNAVRSYGYLLSTVLPGAPNSVRVEISGAARPLNVEVDRKRGSSKTEMPLPTGVLPVGFEGERFDAVCFDGIVHVLVPGAPRGQDFVRGLFGVLRTKIPSSAYGILFLEGDRMTPVVYVCNTDSTVWESSCGSGSTAVAVHRALQKGGEYCGSLHQPGGVIEVEAVEKDGKVVKCSMGGPVRLSKEMTVELPDL